MLFRPLGLAATAAPTCGKNTVLKLIILYDIKTHHGKPQKGVFGEAIMPILEPKSAYFESEKGRFCNALVMKPLYVLAHSPHFLYYGAHSFYFLSAG